VLLLFVSFGALAGLYILLGAPFVAAIQIIVYAGAIMVLFLFVVMLLNVPAEDASKERIRLLTGVGPRRFGVVLAVLLVAELFWAMSRLETSPLPPGGTEGASVLAIGTRLFTEYTFAFEATTILILVAMVGSIVLARKEPRG
jgi:NADH-quinone oxidoreductase subunit J